MEALNKIMNFMLRFGKQLGATCLLLLASHQAMAFSLGGPIGTGADAYQTATLSYDLPGDVLAPKNLGEEFRHTVPNLYWATDSSFLDYFGSNGLHAVEQAYSTLNQLTNVSSYSYDLQEFPLESGRVNYLAQSLRLMDVKSTIMALSVEHLGLAEPDRYTWALRARIPPPGAPQCFFEYHTIMRNFDPVTWAPSRYVNGTRYSYEIIDFCPAIDRADAFEVLTDPLSPPGTAVAAFPGYPVLNPNLGFVSGGLFQGVFYSTLTRDDVGGLRYLYRSSNRNYENVPTDTLQFQTNANPQLIYGSNLTLLAAQALTNTAAQLQALYPGLTVTSSSNFFQTVWLTNLTAYFTNQPWAPVGSLPQLVIVTNRTLAVQTYYRHNFENIAVLTLGPNGWEANTTADIFSSSSKAFVTYQTINVTNAPWAPIGGGGTNVGTIPLITNVTTRTVLTNTVVGEFFILPTNTCAISVLDVVLTNVLVNTNVLVQSTNDPTVVTNLTTAFSYTVNQLDYFTNHALVVLPVNCVTNTAELREGVERIQFVRKDYDSLLGRFFRPITNDYSLTAVVSNNAVVQNFRRIVTVPDILIEATDLDVTFAARSKAWTSNGLAGNAGPGTIEPQMVITMNKTGPLLVNLGTGDENLAITNFVWASFNASTNDPIIYPIGYTIQDLENLIVMQIAPGGADLPFGTVGLDYGNSFDGFTAAGGHPPYTWSVLPGLPANLVITPGSPDTSTAYLSGIPASPGLYQFTIRITDSASRSVDRVYNLRINP